MMTSIILKQFLDLFSIYWIMYERQLMSDYLLAYVTWYDFNFTIQSYELQKWKGILILILL